ncbi:MAG TPA: hypothetical protein VH327_04235 [Gammaproteobacteria bacterium]|nr:hypothetical protein [Gammaproteobacteria bacterium]
MLRLRIEASVFETPRRRAHSAFIAVLLYLAAGAACADTPPTAAELGRCPAPDTTRPEQWHGQHIWTALQKAGYTIERVDIQVDGVFDLADPKENTWYARTADALHINTHQKAVREQLLIEPGQKVDARRIYESERRLRALSYLRFADLVPLACSGDTVVVQAHVADAWSLKLDVNFAHVGGQSNLGASFEDVNFLGTGKTLMVGHKSDVQRISNQVSYQDPALLGSRWTLAATYAHLSDGFTRSVDLGQPFYEDQAPWSLFVHYLDQQQNLNFYQDSVVAWRAADITQKSELDWMRLLYWDGAAGMRAGVSYIDEDIRYGALQQFPPEALVRPVLTPRRFSGPAGTYEYYQDNYGTFTNLVLIGRTEDYNIGWDDKVQLGYFGERFGSRAAAWFYDLSSSYGSEPLGDSLFLSSAELRGRHQQTQDQGVDGQMLFTFYNQSLPHQTLVLHGELGYSLRPDPEDLQYLGGLQGMPGYPNFYLLGDRRWQANVSDRVVTNMYLFNIFQIGFAVYADAGQIRQLGDAGWSRTLADAGIALRLGDVRSAYGGVIYVTYAWPLVKLPGATQRQFVVGNIINF